MVIFFERRHTCFCLYQKIFIVSRTFFKILKKNYKPEYLLRMTYIFNHFLTLIHISPLDFCLFEPGC